MDHVEGGAPFRMTVGLRQVALHDEPVPVLHQGMAHEAEHGAGSRRFLVEPGIRVRGGSMGGVGPLLALEVDLGIAALARGSGHLGGFNFGCFGLILSSRVGSGWATRIVIGRGVVSLQLETFH